MIIDILHVIGLIAGIHALLSKRNSHSALLWLVVCLMFPGLGALLYLVFGINRIKGMAKQWQLKGLRNYDSTAGLFPEGIEPLGYSVNERRLYDALNTTADNMEGTGLLAGCHVRPLFSGMEAYPAMLAAIRQAKKTVYLGTYIFGTKGYGRAFIEALSDAVDRGVDVKVLIDGIGVMYSMPTAYRLLRKRGVDTKLFLPPFKNWYYTIHLNLRNHRKIMVVDGCLGFTGGINIHRDNFAPKAQSAKIQDLHFEVEGPIVGVLQDVFLKGWYFASKNERIPEVVYFDDTPKGSMLCRGIASGPHRKYPDLHYMLATAFQTAEKEIRIITPYLVLSASLGSALAAAAMRGVNVEIILPEHNNLSFVKGACEAQLPSILRARVKVYYQQTGFMHTKLILIDKVCSFVGSANLDIRSVYLNFEFGIQVMDKNLNHDLQVYFERLKALAKPITLDSMCSQPFWLKLRNGIFKLFSPYL